MTRTTTNGARAGKGSGRPHAVSPGPPGTTGGLTQRVYEQLKKDLTRGVYRPGEALHEADLAARHHVSKTPVRESLNLLAREGWVDVVPRLGYIVSSISIRDVQDVFQLRLLLEPAAAQLAAERITEDQLRALRPLSRIVYRHNDPDSYAEFLAANREFHTAVARASGNKRLGDVVERLLEEMERFFHLGLGIRDSSGEMAHEHTELIEALVEGNGTKASEIMREQVTMSRRRVIEAILADDSAEPALVRVL